MKPKYVTVLSFLGAIGRIGASIYIVIGAWQGKWWAMPAGLTCLFLAAEVNRSTFKRLTQRVSSYGAFDK